MFAEGPLDVEVLTEPGTPWWAWSARVDGTEVTALGVPAWRTCPAHLRCPGRYHLAFEVTFDTQVHQVSLRFHDEVLTVDLDGPGPADADDPAVPIAYRDLVRWLNDPDVLLGDLITGGLRLGSSIYLLSFFEGLVGATKNEGTQAVGRIVAASALATASAG